MAVTAMDWNNAPEAPPSRTRSVLLLALFVVVHTLVMRTREEARSDLRVIRGGSFQEDGIFLRLANRSFLDGPDPKADPKDEAYYGKSSNRVGFRCVEE